MKKKLDKNKKNKQPKKLIENITAEKQELEEKAADKGHQFKKNKRKINKWKKRLLAIFIFILALAPRLYFLFFAVDPQNAGAGWYGDTYHHWQIAYLTKTVGFKHGFLRLWDLKGMEYFWGLLHPLILVFLMAITGSIDIILTRLR